MRVAVVGASGRVGALIAEVLEVQGHEVRALHRHSAAYPVDLVTGAGLTQALAGVEVVIHAANPSGLRRPGPVLVDGTRRLLEAGDAHHVCVSIVGCDRLAPVNRYYRAKFAQEQLVAASERPFSIVRSTQFHEFLGAFAIRAARAGVELRSRARFAPVSAREAASVIARVATAAPTQATLQLSGRETLTLTQLRARRGLWLPLPLGPRLERELRAGALIPAAPDVRGVLSYTQWLADARGRPWRPAPGR